MPETTTNLTRIRLVKGNIAQLPVDAVVTAANSALMGGGGVDGAVHRAAGPELLKALRSFNGCPDGEAVVTPGFHLAAKWVIHAVGPIYINGHYNEAETLASTYRSSLQLAVENRAKSIAFPCISTGAFRFPQAEAAEVAIRTIEDWVAEYPEPETIYFCLFENTDVSLYEQRLKLSVVPVEQVSAGLEG